jgi:hypothetical protein
LGTFPAEQPGPVSTSQSNKHDAETRIAHVSPEGNDDAVIAFLLFRLEIYQAEQQRKRKLH